MRAAEIDAHMALQEYGPCRDCHHAKAIGISCPTLMIERYIPLLDKGISDFTGNVSVMEREGGRLSPLDNESHRTGIALSRNLYKKRPQKP